MGVRGRETGRKGEKERAVLLRGAGCGGLKRGLELAFFFPKDFQRESCAQSAESPFFFLKKKKKCDQEEEELKYVFHFFGN